MDRIEEPQNERSRRTRAALLDAAWELIEESSSTQQVTMEAVAARAGVSRRALYLHFASRGELLLALHVHVDERLGLAASLQPLSDAPDAVAMLEAFVAHLASYHPRIQRIDAAVLRAADTDADVAALVERGKRAWHDACQGLTRRLADEGRLADPWTVATAADLLWSFMFPETLERLTGERAWTADRYRELLTVVLRRTLVREG